MDSPPSTPLQRTPQPFRYTVWGATFATIAVTWDNVGWQDGLPWRRARWAAFLPMPAAELRDRPVTVEQVWGRPAIAELRDRLATAPGPHEMLTLREHPGHALDGWPLPAD
jgi:hypothetical protein